MFVFIKINVGYIFVSYKFLCAKISYSHDRISRKFDFLIK